MITKDSFTQGMTATSKKNKYNHQLNQSTKNDQNEEFPGSSLKKAVDPDWCPFFSAVYHTSRKGNHIIIVVVAMKIGLTG